MLKVTHRPEPLATAKASDALVCQLSAYEHLFTPELLAELRELLRRYPAKAIVRCLEQACDELVAQGRGPTWPDAGESDAFAELVAGLSVLPAQRAARVTPLRSLQQSA